MWPKSHYEHWKHVLLNPIHEKPFINLCSLRTDNIWNFPLYDFISWEATRFICVCKMVEPFSPLNRRITLFPLNMHNMQWPIMLLCNLLMNSMKEMELHFDRYLGQTNGKDRWMQHELICGEIERKNEAIRTPVIRNHLSACDTPIDKYLSGRALQRLNSTYSHTSGHSVGQNGMTRDLADHLQNTDQAFKLSKMEVESPDETNTSSYCIDSVWWIMTYKIHYNMKYISPNYTVISYTNI